MCIACYLCIINNRKRLRVIVGAMSATFVLLHSKRYFSKIFQF